jgi:hypothetical protein
VKEERAMNKTAICTAILVATLGAFASRTRAQTVIDFEDLAPGSSVKTQYAARGVLFNGNYLDSDGAAHSGSHVLRAIAPSVEFFDIVPLVITFTSPQARVKLFAGSQFGSANAALKAFDASNNVVASAGPRLVQQNTFTTSLEATAPDAVITRVELQLEGSSFVSIDDLEFQGSAPATLPTQSPVVTLTQPIDGVNVDIPNDIPKLDIKGTVSGDGLLSGVTVTLAFKRPPQSASLPPLTLELSLDGTGTTRPFALPGGISGLPIGPIVVTATAENIAALKGSAVSHLTNLPLAIRNRFASDGGAATYGEFQYGMLKGCTIAVYEHGAISAKNGGAIAIRGDVFNKWLSLTGPFNDPGWFGCPTNEEGDTLGARSQPFERGRIYTHLPAPSPGPFYVPAVFTAAIDKRGGDAGVGLPLADPTDSPGVLRTWLFQRFARPGDPPWIIPSTLEIRGTPAVLWMERQAGPWLSGPGILSGTFQRSAFDESTNKSPATLWESFPCNDSLGPCSVAAEPEFPPPIAPADQPNFGVQFCQGTTYTPGLPGPPEWQAVRGQYDVTPVFGAIISSHMADIDNGFTHRTHNANCPYLGDGLALGSILLGGPIGYGTYVAATEYGVTCASDYEWFVRPLGPMIDTRPQLPSLFGKSNTDRIKTEYEEAYAAAAHQFLGTPSVGDLVHTTGRWIVDCGHDTYKTELHPIFSYARMKTVVTETNAFTGLEDPLFGGKPATRIGIWVNGWYPGGDNNPIEFDIFPPPRPSATALLHVVKPVDNASGGFRAAEDVDLTASMGPAGAVTKVHMRFTATRRENPVSGAGEMLFQPGRQYWGIWYLYWGD